MTAQVGSDHDLDLRMNRLEPQREPVCGRLLAVPVDEQNEDSLGERRCVFDECVMTGVRGQELARHDRRTRLDFGHRAAWTARRHNAKPDMALIKYTT